VINSIKNINCYKYSYSEKAQMDKASRGSSVTTQTVTKDEIGLIDLEGRNAKQSIKSMKLDCDGNALNEQEIEKCLIKDELYTKTNGKWARSMVSGPIKQFAFDERDKLRCLEDLINDANIEVIGKETVDGQKCYKLKVVPGPDTARSILAAQALEVQSSVPGSLPAVSYKDLSKSDPLLHDGDISYTVWVTEDEYIPVKIDGVINFALTPATMNVKPGNVPDFRVDAAIEDTLVLSDFNDIDNIEVPEETDETDN
jgi:hypothetical protein